jgi:arylsulfatase A-like enzyme
MWWGLVAGLGEGAGFLGFQHLGWLNWKMAQLSVAPEILWISPIFDLLLFSLIALGLCVAGSLVRAAKNARLVVFLFALLTAYDWLALSGRLLLFAVVILAVGLAVFCARGFAAELDKNLRRIRRSLPWLAAATVIVLAGVEGSKRMAERSALAGLAPAAAGAPNVLILVMDTVRADHLSGYGYRRATTPQLDTFARQGVQFDNAISTSSWTLPAHGSLLTGRFPHEHGAERGRYDGRFPTLPEEFERRGYRTAAFSANSSFFSRAVGYGKGFTRFEDIFDTPVDMAARTLFGRKFYQVVLQRLGYDDIPGRKTAEQVTRSVERWLDGSGSPPFFAVANYFDAHDPYLPPQPYRSRFSPGKIPGGALNSFVLRLNLRSPDQLQGEIDAYDGAISYIDDQIGGLLRWMDQRGLSRNTLVVILSDHGESFGEHGLLMHRNALYRETIQIPLLVRWPDHVPGGIHVAAPVSLASVAATVLELAGGNDSARFPGPSLVSFWRDAASPPGSAYPLAELAQFPFELEKQNPVFSGAIKSVVTPQWQYIRHEKYGAALFDWATDPGDLRDLAGSDEGRAVTEGLTRCLKEDPRKLDAAHCGPEK